MTYKAKEWPEGMDRANVSQRLQALRQVFGHSHNYLAARCGVSQSTYSKYENGKLDITTRSAAYIAELYGVDLDYVLLGDVAQIPTGLALKLGIIEKKTSTAP